MRKFLISLGLVLAAISSAHAWYDHATVMTALQPTLEREVPAPSERYGWSGRLPAVPEERRVRYVDVAPLLLLQSRAAADLPSRDARTLHDLLRLGAEDPDHGMDADLPDSADPSDDRRAMGGTTGLSSGGFRHHYWAGWNWRKPFASLQFPLHRLGQAPDRVELLATEARDRARKGDLEWATRILGWTFHYLQDLAQPFHAVEVPTPKMLMPSALFTWPPQRGFENFVAQTYRVVTNYHWAYEGYVKNALVKEPSLFRDCFEKSGGSFLITSPRELALEVAQVSAARARETGEAIYALAGPGLRATEVSVPLNPAQIDVDDFLKNPLRADARARMNAVTCDSLRLATDATIWITRWVFGR